MNTSRYLLLSVSTLLIASAAVPTSYAGGRGGGGGGRGGQTIPETAHSLIPVTGASKAPDAAGFIQRWIVLEPIPCNGQVTQNAVQATVKQEYFPNQFTVIPKDGDKVTVGGTELTWHALDTKNYNFNLYHFGHVIVNKDPSNSIFWALAVVNCPEEMKNVRLAAGSNSATVWWLNGQEIVDIYGDIQTTIDDGVSKRITLKKGANIIRVAMVNNGGACDFCARFLDEQGNPIKNFTVSLSDK